MTARWLKGNLHTHTTNSDGDSSPRVVVAWYRDHGYDFLAITDHDLFTETGPLRRTAGSMLLVRGEELTPAETHVNGLGIAATVTPEVRQDRVELLQANVDAVLAAGGIPSINHPNFRWQLTAAQLAAVRDVRLFEVYNGGPDCNNEGGIERASTEAAWDAVLTAGRRLFGIAVDDAHHFKAWGRELANPGRGWVGVRAEDATESAVLTALEAGDSYASMGIELADLDLSGAVMCLDIVPTWDTIYTTTFICRGGQLLDVVGGTAPRYQVTGSEGYVRARVDDSNGLRAWTQPRFIG